MIQDFSALEKRIDEFSILRFIKSHITVILGLGLLACFAYMFSLNNGFTSDDIDGILKNPDLNNLSYALTRFPPAIQTVLYYVTYSLFGYSAFAFRFINNVSFHILTVIAVFTFVYLLNGRKTAVLSSAFFAVHPLLVESVAWISGNSYPRYSFFIILGLILYILSWKNQKYFIYSILSFFLSLVSSEKAVIFPFFIITLHLTYQRSFANLKKYLWVGIFPVGLVIYHLFNLSSRMAFLRDIYFQDQYLRNPLLQIPTAVSTYLELLFMPLHLTHYHSEVLTFDIIYMLRLLVFIVLLCLVVFAYKKNKNLFFWLSFYLIALSPTLTPYVASWLVAERYAYLPSIGILVCVALLTSRLLQKKEYKSYVLAVYICILVLLFIRTVVRTFEWKNEFSLWSSTVKTNPTHPQAHYNLGYQKFLLGDINGARSEFETAIILNPKYVNPYHALGNIYYKLEDIPTAIGYYDRAVNINPNFWYSHYSLAEIYYKQGNYDQVLEELNASIAVVPKYAPLYASLGATYFAKHDMENAKKSFRKALSIDPANVQAAEGLRQLVEVQ